MFTMRLGLHRHIPCRASRGLTSSDTAQHCKNCYSNSVKKEHHIFVVLSVFISIRNISNKGLFFQSMQQITIYQAIIESYDQLGLRLKFSCSEVASHFRNQNGFIWRRTSFIRTLALFKTFFLLFFFSYLKNDSTSTRRRRRLLFEGQNFV